MRKDGNLSAADLDDIDEPQLHGTLAAISRRAEEIAEIQAVHIVELLAKAINKA